MMCTDKERKIDSEQYGIQEPLCRQGHVGCKATLATIGEMSMNGVNANDIGVMPNKKGAALLSTVNTMS